MRTILNLFGRSPFAPLKSHMDKVSTCVQSLTQLFNALLAGDYEQVEKIAASISETEHLADVTKNDIRSHLPKSLFLPIERGQLLEVLRIQDDIADQAEDVAVLATLKRLELPQPLKQPFLDFLAKNIETFEGAHRIIKELHDLLESSFGGIEAEKVRHMVDEVAYREHQVDVLQRQLLKLLFSQESALSYGSFHLWLKIFEAIADISNLSEKLAYRMRLTLELK